MSQVDGVRRLTLQKSAIAQLHLYAQKLAENTYSRLTKSKNENSKEDTLKEYSFENVEVPRRKIQPRFLLNLRTQVQKIAAIPTVLRKRKIRIIKHKPQIDPADFSDGEIVDTEEEIEVYTDSSDNEEPRLKSPKTSPDLTLKERKNEEMLSMENAELSMENAELLSESSR